MTRFHDEGKREKVKGARGRKKEASRREIFSTRQHSRLVRMKIAFPFLSFSLYVVVCLPVASLLSPLAQISCITSSFLLLSLSSNISPLSYSFFLLSPSLALFKVTPSFHNLFPLYVHIPFWAWNMTRECVCFYDMV